MILLTYFLSMRLHALYLQQAGLKFAVIFAASFFVCFNVWVLLSQVLYVPYTIKGNVITGFVRLEVWYSSNKMVPSSLQCLVFFSLV